MTAWDLVVLLGAFLAILLTEFLILYASTALGNVDLNFGKWLASSCLVAAVWAAVCFAGHYLIHRSGGEQPLGPENRLTLILVSAGGIVLSWALLGALFIPIFPTSFGRGMLISLFQVLLRGLLYALIGAVVMVVLAVIQLVSAPKEKRPSPATSAPDVVLTRAA